LIDFKGHYILTKIAKISKTNGNSGATAKVSSILDDSLNEIQHVKKMFSPKYSKINGRVVTHRDVVPSG